MVVLPDGQRHVAIVRLQGLAAPRVAPGPTCESGQNFRPVAGLVIHHPGGVAVAVAEYAAVGGDHSHADRQVMLWRRPLAGFHLGGQLGREALAEAVYFLVGHRPQALDTLPRHHRHVVLVQLGLVQEHPVEGDGTQTHPAAATTRPTMRRFPTKSLKKRLSRELMAIFALRDQAVTDAAHRLEAGPGLSEFLPKGRRGGRQLCGR